VLPRCAETLSRNICFHLKLQDSTNYVFLVKSSEILAVLGVLYIDIETYILTETFSIVATRRSLTPKNFKSEVKHSISHSAPYVGVGISKIDVTWKRRSNDTIQSRVSLVSIDPR